VTDLNHRRGRGRCSRYCYGVCPDNAIIKLADGQYAVDRDYCGLYAVDMEPEQT
jgi:Pyruvate/2-oxoacid:ferredoxin oxidoreductase delta subunit